MHRLQSFGKPNFASEFTKFIPQLQRKVIARKISARLSVELFIYFILQWKSTQVFGKILLVSFLFFVFYRTCQQQQHNVSADQSSTPSFQYQPYTYLRFEHFRAQHSFLDSGVSQLGQLVVENYVYPCETVTLRSIIRRAKQCNLSRWSLQSAYLRF